MSRRSAASRVFVFDADLDAVVEVTRTNRPLEPKAGEGMQIIRDLEPYQAVATDRAIGKPPIIMGRRQHREFLARNHYVETGNENVMGREPVPLSEERREQRERIEVIKHAMGRL